MSSATDGEPPFVCLAHSMACWINDGHIEHVDGTTDDDCEFVTRPVVDVHRKPAREQFPADQIAFVASMLATDRIMPSAVYDAAMDRIDALEQEVVTGGEWIRSLKDELDALDQENVALRVRGTVRIEGGVDADLHVAALAELRSLRAAVATWAKAHTERLTTPKPWEGYADACERLATLPPADGSWLEENQ